MKPISPSTRTNRKASNSTRSRRRWCRSGRRCKGYLNRNMDTLDEKVEERFAARQAAGEPDPIYRSWIFQPMEVRAARYAKST